MQKTYIHIILFIGALMAAGCSQDDGTPQGTPGEQAIVFSADVAEPSTTRAAQTGVMDYRVLAQTGFGVYAYQTDGTDYSETLAPNLLCNRKVFATKDALGTTIEPAPLNFDYYVYPYTWSYGNNERTNWPKATADKISFFAYAPFAEAPKGANDPDVPTDEGQAGSPRITYHVAEKPSESVDLLWGINNSTQLPWLNQTRASIDGEVLFTFHHAMTAIGYHVQAMADRDNQLDNLHDESQTGLFGTDNKITIERVTLKGSFYRQAVLNLNSGTDGDGNPVPNWSGEQGTISQLVLEGDEMDDALRDRKTDDTKPHTPDNLPTGVTEQSEQLLIRANAAGSEQCFFVIPNTNEQTYTVTLSFYLTTTDEHQDEGYKRQLYTVEDIPVVFTKGTGEGTSILKPMTKYYLNFVIGLESVRLHVVTIEPWDADPIDRPVTIEYGTSAHSSLSRTN